MPLFPQKVLSINISSLRDCAKQIPNIGITLLFGVGCGAPTTASSPTNDDYDGNDNIDYSPKKARYVKVLAKN